MSHRLSDLNLAPRRLHVVVWFGIALIILTWFGCYRLLESERSSLKNDLEQDISNIAITLEQSVSKTRNDLDRIIKFLRMTYERSGYALDWPSLLKEEFTLDDHSVQIAIIDVSGTMITSSAMLYPKQKVDLSDREHFRVHVNSKEDRLFISKPVLGRASGQWSVQFTRKLVGKNGDFAGVIVISLDPKFLAQTYAGLELGQGHGLAVVSADGTVLSGSGIFLGQMGKSLSLVNHRSTIAKAGSTIAEAKFQNFNLTVVKRTLKSSGMSVYVAASSYERQAHWYRLKMLYIGLAMFVTLIVVAATAIMNRRCTKYEAEIVALARRDPLTGLNNRAGFQCSLESALEAAFPKQTCALHIIDLDRFKTVNDTFGHYVGDILLVQVAARLRSIIRSEDVLSRLGGDEFAIVQILSDSNDYDERLAGRICVALSQPFLIEGRELAIGASVGSALSVGGCLTPEQMLIQSDLAMYAAKEEGRNTYKLYTKELGTEYAIRTQMESELHDALARHEFKIEFQVINNLANGQPVGVEALIRWNHPVRGLIAPAEFISVAEKSNLIIQIGQWVLTEGCKQFSEQRSIERLAVNCSAAQFRDPGFVSMVKAALAHAGLQPHRLELEITESLLLDSSDLIMNQLRQLRAIGVRISIDDFGTGYSSLSYLDKYPIDVVKIDRSFVKNIGLKASADAIVASVVNIASSLNVTTIAEGIETHAQWVALRKIGCVEGQGFLFGKPMALSDIGIRERSNATHVAA